MASKWKDVDKKRHVRGLCNHLRVPRNQLLLTCVTCEGLNQRSGHVTVCLGKLKAICGVMCLRNVNTRVGDKFMLDVYV